MCAGRLLLLAVTASPLIAQSTTSPPPITVKVVLDTMFKRGEERMLDDRARAITLLTSRVSQREPRRRERCLPERCIHRGDGCNHSGKE